MLPFARLLFCLLLLFASGNADAQKDANATSDAGDGNKKVWRKRVHHTIYLSNETNIDNSKVEVKRTWAAFFKQLIQVGRLGENTKFGIDPYTTADLSQRYFEDQHRGSHREIVDDSFYLIPTDTGDRKVKILEFDYSNFLKLKLCEHWVYDPATGKTTIEIASVSPMRAIYGDDGVYRGCIQTGWYKWSDFVKYAGNYKGFDVLKSLGTLISEDYFRDTAVIADTCNPVTIAGVLEKTGVRKISLIAEVVPEYPKLWSDFDTSITQILYSTALSGDIHAFKNEGYERGTVLNTETLKQTIKTPDDTAYIMDPITGDKYIKLIHHDFCFECVCRYYVEEKWTLDIEKGRSEIVYTGIAPAKSVVNNGGISVTVPMFWVNYTDAKRVLGRYYEFNPNHSIESELWDERFKEPGRKSTLNY